MLHFLLHEPLVSAIKSTDFGYIPALDYLSGFAAVLVLFFLSSHLISHNLNYSTPYDPANWIRVGNLFSALAIEGHAVVSLFFLLSGFVFTVGSLQGKTDLPRFLPQSISANLSLFSVLSNSRHSVQH